jgi:hypothetical protein
VGRNNGLDLAQHGITSGLVSQSVAALFSYPLESIKNFLRTFVNIQEHARQGTEKTGIFHPLFVLISKLLRRRPSVRG